MPRDAFEVGMWLLLVAIIGGLAWAISFIVPWWGCVIFGVIGLCWMYGVLGGPDY